MTALAQEPELTDEQQAYFEQIQALVNSLEPQTGDIVLGDDLATLHVPDDFYFLDSEDAEKVLVDIWGNPPGQNVMGMLFPAEFSPVDYEAWAVTVEYSAEGHVSDADAADIDYDDLLESMQDDTSAANEERVAAGYDRVELLGWAEPPRYDQGSRKLYWAKTLQFGEAEDTTLNYDIRALGRTGVLSMTFIASGSQLDAINARREAVLAMAEFNPGNRYDDFDSSIDKVAAYGIGALVAGKVAAKAGLFGAFFLLLKKFGVLILIGLGAMGKKIAGLFRTDKLQPPGA
jgi:uncharacterized membrane-anchored protein